MIKYVHLPSGAALAAVVMLGGCGGGGGGARVAMEPGEWEMSARVTNVRVDNLPPEMREEARRMQTGEARTSRDCMSATADVIRIENLRVTIPGPGRTSAGCRIAELAMEGGRISGRMSCEGMPAGGAETMSMSGELNGTYTANSLDVTARGDMRMGARGGSAEMRITGRRLGACPAPRSYMPPPTPMTVPMPAPSPPPMPMPMPMPPSANPGVENGQ